MARGLRIGHRRGFRLSADGTTYVLTGQTATNLKKASKLTAAQGSYAVSGQAATFSVFGSSGSTAADVDWAQRILQPGILRWFDFNDASSLGADEIQNPSAPVFIGGPRSESNPAVHDPNLLPVISTEKKRSGTAAMKMPVRSMYQAQSTKWQTWFGNTQTDVLIGENEEIWIQFSTLWTPQMQDIIRRWPATKFGGVGTGGAAGPEGTMYGDNWMGMVWSHQAVSNSTGAVPTIYANEHTLSTSGGVRDGGDFRDAGGADLQQGLGGTCLYSDYIGGNFAGCGTMPYDTWVTFTIQFKLLTRRTTPPYTTTVVNGQLMSYIDFEYRQWLAYPGLPPKKIFDWHAGVGPEYEPMCAGPAGRNDGLGRIDLTCYMTAKDNGRTPISTISNSNFVGTNQHLLMDDTWKVSDTSYDADYAYSADGTTAELVVGLETGGQPYEVNTASGNIYSDGRTTLRYRAARTANGVLAPTGGAVTCQAQILEGATVRATGSVNTLTGSFQNFDERLLLTNVTNWDNLRAKLTIAGNTGRGGAISLVNLGGAHEEGAQWYDEVIIGTQALRQPYPEWRVGKAVGQVYSIQNTAPNTLTAQLLANTGAGSHDLRDGWIGFTLDEANGRWLSINSGGSTSSCNANWCNPILQIKFWENTPVWSAIDWGTNSQSKISARRYYKDGRPISRHTYSQSVYFAPGKLQDRKERVAHLGGYATLANQAYSWDPVTLEVSPGSIAITCGFDYDPTKNIQTNQNAKSTNGFDLCRLNPSDWFAHTGTHQSGTPYDGSVHGWETDLNSTCPSVNPANGGSAGEYQSSIAQNPVTGDLWVGGGGATGTDALWKYTAATSSWSGSNTQPLMTRGQQPLFKGGQGRPSLFDRYRNKIVTLWAFSHNTGQWDPEGRLIVTTPAAPYTTTNISLTGHGVQAGAPRGMVTHDCRMVHCLDDDRYYVYTVVDASNGADWRGILWKMNPDTGACSIAHIESSNVNAVNNYCFDFIPDLHCFVWCDRVSQNIRFMPTK